MATRSASPSKSFMDSSLFLPSLSSALNSLAFISSNGKMKWERWRVLDLVRCSVMFIFCFGVWIIRSLLVHLPHPVAATGLLESLSQGSSFVNKTEKENAYRMPPQFYDSAIGRALSQVLALVNEVPVSSEKYEFARTLADKIIHQNIAIGDLSSKDVNRVVLAAGFARTLKLLTFTLEGLHHQREVEAYSWPWRLIHMLPLRGFDISPQLLSLHNLRIRLSNVLLPLSQTGGLPSELFSSKLTVSAGNETDSVVAEKLAQELLWMAQKLKECSALEEAIVQWSLASCLASLSLSAHPRAQSSLLRVSVLLFKELTFGEVEASRELKFKLLLLWLPLFCCAKNGYDTPIFTSAEKIEVVGILEKNIMSLPSSEQEIVLATWLKEYTLSASDWPNLQQCFDNWCQASWKL